MKLNPYGDTIWLRQNFPVFGLISIIEVNNGNYVALGRTSDSFGQYLYLVKINPDGNTLWTKTISEQGYDVYPSNISKTYDNNFIISGKLQNSGNCAYYSKIDNNGNKIWSRFIDPQSGNKSFALGKQLIDSSFIFVGSIMSWNGPQIYLVKTNSNGDTIWTKSYGNLNIYESGYSVFQTKDKGFYVIGLLLSGNPTSGKLILLKTDSFGNLQFTKIFSDPNSSYMLFLNLAIENIYNNSYIITGYKTNYPQGDTIKAFILNLDTSGNKIWEKGFKKDTLDVWGWSIDNCNDSGFIVCGQAFQNTLLNDLDPPSYLYVLKTNKFGEINPIGINPNSNEIPKVFKLYQNYPNPFNPLTTIKYDIPPVFSKYGQVSLKIYDIAGREVFNVNEFRQAGCYSVTFDGTNFASGLYLYQLKSGSYVESKKMVLIK